MFTLRHSVTLHNELPATTIFVCVCVISDHIFLFRIISCAITLLFRVAGGILYFSFITQLGQQTIM